MVRYVCVATFGIAVASLLFCIRAGAAEQFGRLSVGAFTSTEKFTSNWDGAPENDAQNFTGRIYYRLFDMGTSRTEFVLDIRDNYDMFGALNLTQQELDAKNVLQARTLYVGNFPGKSSWNYEFGRFALNETGGTYTDGLVLQHRWSNAWRTGLFGGLNPLSEASQVVSSNPGATDFGFYTSYEPSDFRLVRNFFAHFAFVQNQFQSDVDRQYLYENLYYQWAPQSRILSTTYLDFVPNVKIQTGTFNYDQKVSERQVAHLHLLAVDTITYRRLQNVRSTLPASPYQQGKLYWDFVWGRASLIQPQILSGHRQIDGLSKTEEKLNVIYRDHVDSRWDTQVYFGQRQNFASQDTFFGFGLGYYSARWEFSGEAESASEKYATLSLHPITATANASYIQNRDLFYVASLEYAQDENVVIWASFLKLTYRFGSKEVPPLRDGAPMRGAL